MPRYEGGIHWITGALPSITPVSMMLRGNRSLSAVEVVFHFVFRAVAAEDADQVL